MIDSSDSLRVLGIAVFGLMAASGASLCGASEPTPEVRVTLVTSPANAGLTTNTTWREGAGGARILEVVLQNDRNEPIALERAQVEIPWLGAVHAKLLISTGGTTMATSPTQVVDVANHGAGAITSGTYLLAKNDDRYHLAAFVSWRTFWSKLSYADGSIVASADGEGRILQPGERVSLETIRFSAGDDWQNLLFGYADELARQLDKKMKPRPSYVGWSTWDYYGRNWTAEDVITHVDEVRKLAPAANLLQIDGGWWPERGDYKEFRANLQPGGMKALADAIREEGFTAGIHFDGMRGDLESRIAKEHPEFFLKDESGRLISVPQQNDGDRLDHIYFDFSHPGAVEYMRDVARNMRKGWGYDYIKIDFLMYGLNEDIRARALKNDPARKIVPHDSTLTSVERMHRALRAWREGMGDDAFFLACSAPFGPVLGYADGLRTGYDIDPSFTMARRCAQATAGMFYLHGRVTWNDADYHVARAAEDEDGARVKNARKQGTLTLNEARMWSHYVGLFGGTKLNSDKLTLLREERRELFKQAVALPSCERYVPLDYWAHGAESGRRL